MVTARLADGTLKVLEKACPNLLYEAALYRWDDDEDGSETPVSEHNHALDALRYLVSRLDQCRPADPNREAPPSDSDNMPPPAPPPKSVFRSERDLRNDPDVWTSLS